MWVYIYHSRPMEPLNGYLTRSLRGTRIEVLKERALQEVKAARDKPVGVCSVFSKQQAHWESHGNNGDGQPGRGHVARNQKSPGLLL